MIDRLLERFNIYLNEKAQLKADIRKLWIVINNYKDNLETANRSKGQLERHRDRRDEEIKDFKALVKSQESLVAMYKRKAEDLGG